MTTHFDPAIWIGRDDQESGDTRRLHHLVRQTTIADTTAPAIMGFATDSGVARNHGRVGAGLGPDAIRRALANLPAHQLQALWDAGTIQGSSDLEHSQQQAAEAVAMLLNQQRKLVVLGGGHEIAWATFSGLSQHLASQAGAEGSVLVINLDAHFDLRSTRPANSGTPFHQILEWAQHQGKEVYYLCLGVAKTANTPGLYAQADRPNVSYLEDWQMQERHLDQVLAYVQDKIDGVEHVYLSIDLDVLPASVAPGVSAPAAYGVPMSVIESLCVHIKRSGKLKVADIAELNPTYDNDQHTARLAARLAWQLLQP